MCNVLIEYAVVLFIHIYLIAIIIAAHHHLPWMSQIEINCGIKCTTNLLLH